MDSGIELSDSSKENGGAEYVDASALGISEENLSSDASSVTTPPETDSNSTNNGPLSKAAEIVDDEDPKDMRG